MGTTSKPPPLAQISRRRSFSRGENIWDPRRWMAQQCCSRSRPPGSSTCTAGPVWTLPDKYALVTDN